MDRVPLTCLLEYIEAADFKGYDPYDALNSPILRALSFQQKFLRIAFIQLLKRLPVNLRPLLLIKKDYNPKGLGLFLWGYAKLYAREKDPRYLEQIDRLLDLLEGLKSRDCSGNGWGYNFDWQSRAFLVPGKRGDSSRLFCSFLWGRKSRYNSLPVVRKSRYNSLFPTQGMFMTSLNP